MKAILHYLDEGWLGKTLNKVHGLVYRYDPDNDNITRLKDVPKKDILAEVEGCWQEQIYYSIPNTSAVNEEPNTEPTSKKQLLVDLVPLMPVAKVMPPEEDQLPNESRRLWKDVTTAIVNKQYGEATRVKQVLEERQREKAADRKARNEEWKPRFFTGTTEPRGRPDLNDEGRAALKKLQAGDFRLEESDYTAA